MRSQFRRTLVSVLLILPAIIITLSYLEDLAETSDQGLTEGLGPFLAALPTQLISLASSAGYAGIFTLMLLEAAAFPIPSEIILPFAGYLVSKGTVEFWMVVLCSTIAALIGSFIDYYLGLTLGQEFLTSTSRHPFVNPAHLRRVEAWFNKYGPVAVALFRLVPAARVLISFPAGAYRMSKREFAIYTLAGCLPWNITLVYLGWVLGSSWESVVAAFKYINLVVYVLLVLFVIWLFLKFRPHRLRRQTEN
jgi:membrane protein DedA with SNARE-associated domain